MNRTRNRLQITQNGSSCRCKTRHRLKQSRDRMRNHPRKKIWQRTKNRHRQPTKRHHAKAVPPRKIHGPARQPAQHQRKPCRQRARIHQTQSQRQRLPIIPRHHSTAQHRQPNYQRKIRNQLKYCSTIHRLLKYRPYLSHFIRMRKYQHTVSRH